VNPNEIIPDIEAMLKAWRDQQNTVLMIDYIWKRLSISTIILFFVKLIL